MWPLIEVREIILPPSRWDYLPLLKERNS